MTQQLQGMARRITIVLVSLAALAACSSGPIKGTTSPPASTVKPDLRSRYSQAAQQIKDGDKTGGEKALRELIADPSFGQLSPAEQHWVLSSAGRLALSRKDAQAAYDSLVRSSAMSQADYEDWYLRSYAAARLKKSDDMISSFVTFVRRWPLRLTWIDEEYVAFVVREAEMQVNAKDASREIMEALFDAHWKLHSAEEPSGIWKNLTLRLLESGNRGKAMEVSTRIDHPYDLIAMRVDSRFKELVASHPDSFDIKVATAKYAKDLQVLSDQHPMDLNLRRLVGSDLRIHGKYPAALATLDAIVSDVSTSPNLNQQFEQFNRDFVWVLNERAIILGRLGRWDDAIAQLKAAVKHSEGGGDSPNVSQRINLAEMYCDIERPKDALSEILQLDQSHASPYGIMQVERVRLAAALQLNDRPEADRALSYLRDHRIDAPLTFEQALLDDNRLDEAAGALVEHLHDPVTRASALMSVQRYLDSPAPAHIRTIRERWLSVVSRPDVKAAVASVGTMEQFSLEEQLH